MQLQLLEIAIAIAALFLALHFSSSTSVFLVVVGLLTGALALVTDGPLGIAHRIAPMLNVVILGLIGFVMVFTPIAFSSARTTQAVLVLEGGALIVGLTVFGTLRRPRRGTEPVAATEPNTSVVSPASARTIRSAGRLTGIASARVAAGGPVVARRLGRAVGSIRRRR